MWIASFARPRARSTVVAAEGVPMPSGYAGSLQRAVQPVVYLD